MKNISSLLAALLCATLFNGCSKHKRIPRKPPSVTVVKVRSDKLKREWILIAQTVADNTVDLKARVDGFLEKRNFKEGDFVKKGTILFQIEKDQYKINVDRAKAEVAVKKALLENATLTYKRNKTLLKSHTVSQAEYDQAKADKLAAQGNLDASKAALDDAKLNLSYTDIIAPMDGAIGLSNYSVGNLVGTNTGTLANMVSLDPMCVEFNVSEGDFLFAHKKAEESKMSFKELLALLKVRLILSDGSTYEHPGKIYFWNNKVSASTGTVLMRAHFPNPKHFLLPGQYGKVGILSSKEDKTTFIPQVAVLSDIGGKYVLIVDDKGVVAIRRLELGYTFETMVTIKKGLKPGDMVITQGLQKVRPGMKVTAIIDTTSTLKKTDAPSPKTPEK